jgi:hypothetical protein
MSLSVTVPCDCCTDPDRQCYEITGISTEVLGSPGCKTTGDFEIATRYLEAPAGQSPTAEEVAAAIDGSFVVDCEDEPSGFCRGEGASGSYPLSSASPNGGGGSGSDFSVEFLFEDCGIGNADFRLTVDVTYLGPGRCPSSE